MRPSFGTQFRASVECLDVCQQIAPSSCEFCSPAKGDLRTQIIRLRKPSYAVASSRLSIGFRKSGLDERQAAAVRVGSRQRKMAPRIIIYQNFALVPRVNARG